MVAQRAQSHGNGFEHRGVQADQVRVGFLDRPRHVGAGIRRAKVGDRWQVVDHVAQG
jgi:hypothetical protein